MGHAYVCNVGFSALYFDYLIIYGCQRIHPIIYGGQRIYPIIYGCQRMMTKGIMEVRDLHEQAETGQILVLTCPSGSPRTLTAGTRPLPREVYAHPDPLPSPRPKKP